MTPVPSQSSARVQWQGEFKAAGIEDLTTFKSLIEAVNSIDPAFYSFRYPADPEGPRCEVLDFIVRLENLVELLEHTADSLAAEWDLRSDRISLESGWTGEKPIIQ